MPHDEEQEDVGEQLIGRDRLGLALGADERVDEPAAKRAPALLDEPGG